MEHLEPLFISIPFVAGTAAAVLLPSWAFSGALICCLLLALCFLLFSLKGGKALAAALYFCLGLLICWTAQLLPFKRDYAFTAAMLQALRERIGRLPFENEQSANLLLALLSGQKQALPATIRAHFTASGAAHLLALSGLHLGIVAAFLKASLFFLGRSPLAKIVRNSCVVAASSLYTLVCGASPSLARALIFVLFHCLAELLPHRRCNNASLLCYASCLQLCFNPLSIKSLSFQLSYLACAGIVLLFPFLSSFYPPAKGLVSRGVSAIWNSMAMSLSCQAFTAPLVWLQFGTVPRYFLLTNLLALPLCTILVNLSLLAILAASQPQLCALLCKLVDLLATLLLNCLEIIAKI